MFRGIFYPWAKQSGFPKLALWGTAVFFGAIHFNLISFIPLTLMAVALTISLAEAAKGATRRVHLLNGNGAGSNGADED